MQDKYKIPYINACIRAFAKRFHLPVKNVFLYLYRFEGMKFLDEFYDIEHLQSIDDAVDDLILVCKRNGGELGMILYHGTNIDFQAIEIEKSNPYKDFGRGFYLRYIFSGRKYCK